MIRFNDDGTAEVDYQHETIRLAEPTLSQQAEFYDMLYKVQDQLSANASARDDLEAMRVRDDDGEDITDDETLARIRDRAIELNREASKLSASMISHVVQVLGDKPDLAEKFAEDPPVWAARLTEFTKLIYHFNNIPFDGRGNPDV